MTELELPHPHIHDPLEVGMIGLPTVMVRVFCTVLD